MLKTFALYDKDNNDKKVGVLSYDTGSKQFGIEVSDGIPVEELPLSLEIRVKDDARVIGNDEAISWVRSRICPPGRHNILEILHEYGLKEYDEFELLMVTKAQCDKDGLYLADLQPTG